jgi:two-component system phosphate regulon sensor histidine kinase PhoR
MSKRIPSCRHHKPSGRAVVTLNGRDHYLGPYGSQVSRDEYDRLVGEWLANGRHLPTNDDDGVDLTVVELIAAYLDFAKSYYENDRGTTSEFTCMCEAIRPVRKLYGELIANAFGPLALKAVREQMIANGWCRTHINRQVNRVRRIFKWGVENELIKPQVATPMELVNAQVASVQWLILLNSILVSLAALALSYLIVGRIFRPLATLTQAAKSIAAGDIHQEVEVQSRDELGTLAESFNLMCRELAGRIDELSEKGRDFSENSERLEAVLGGMIEGVLAIDRDERILFANRAAHALLEFSTRDFVGHPIWETVRNSTIQDVVREALESKTPKRIELELPRTQSTVELSANRLPGDPCPGVILVMHDVTELRRLESVRQQFVSNVSHELKTPLAGAIDDDEHNRKFLGRIEEHADRLHSLILDLLRLARIESGKDAFVLTPVVLADAIELCIEEQQGIAEMNQVELKTESAPIEIRVMADEEGLRTILDNLVENAIKYTPQGGHIEVRWRAEDSMAIVEVLDSGGGIAEEHRTRISERFYRIDKARSRELGGTGLGLSIVKHLALEFGGSVEVESELGKGSLFRVRLPLV